MLREGVVLGGRFRVHEELATVGRATVYRATDSRDSAMVAVTVLAGEPPGFDLSRLLRDFDLRQELDAARAAVPPTALGSNRQKRIHRSDTMFCGWGEERGIVYQAWALQRTRNFHLPRAGEFSASVRRASKARADGRCERCGTVGRLELDHILPVSRGGTGEMANGQVLCKTCHIAKWFDDGTLGGATPVFQEAIDRGRGKYEMRRNAEKSRRLFQRESNRLTCAPLPPAASQR